VPVVGCGPELACLPACRRTTELEFLLASKRQGGRAGLSLIGGTWSAELDAPGGDPETDGPAVLSHTATRVVREQLGLDLSTCTWAPFLRIDYHRPAETYKNKSYPEQRETVVGK
jgi:hypothetical protein